MIHDVTEKAPTRVVMMVQMALMMTRQLALDIFIEIKF